VAKKITIGLILFIGLVLIIPVFLKPTFHIERSIIIEKPASEIITTVSDYNTWKNWSPWALNDPAQVVTVSGKPGTVGHVQTWEGQINGKGKQTIASVTPNKEVVFNLEFIDPNPMVSVARMNFEDFGSGTKLTWSNDGDSEYPVGRYFGLFLDGMIGPDFEKGLTNLKNLLEKK